VAKTATYYFKYHFTRRLDPALRLPESYQLNAGFERELPGGVVVEANYTFNRGSRLWREFNALY